MNYFGKKMIGNRCTKSYSLEHSFMPIGDNKIKCSICGKIESMKTII